MKKQRDVSIRAIAERNARWVARASHEASRKANARALARTKPGPLDPAEAAAQLRHVAGRSIFKRHSLPNRKGSPAKLAQLIANPEYGHEYFDDPQPTIPAQILAMIGE